METTFEKINILKKKNIADDIEKANITYKVMSWTDLWESKGRVDSTDLRLLNGFEGTTYDHAAIARKLLYDLGHRHGDSILEVGCGAGLLAQYLPAPYHGVERSLSLAARHRALLGNDLTCADACNLPQADDAFDFVVVFSVMHYLADLDAFQRAVREAVRVARKGVFIGDLRTRPLEVVLGKDKVRDGPLLRHLLVPKEALPTLIQDIPYHIRPPYHEHYGGPYNLLLGTKRPMTIYTDMCADLFHAGHARFLRQCAELYPRTTLVVGVHGDATIESYKRRPMCTHDERVAVVRACKYVSRVQENAPLRVQDLDSYDVVVHADGIDEQSRQDMYGAALERGMYREVPRTPGISTTELIHRIRSWSADQGYTTKREGLGDNSPKIDERYRKLFSKWKEDGYTTLNMYKVVDGTIWFLAFEPTNRGNLNVMWAEFPDPPKDMHQFIDHFYNKGEQFSIDNDKIIDDIKGCWNENYHARDKWLEVVRNIVGRFSHDEDCVHIAARRSGEAQLPPAPELPGAVRQPARPLGHAAIVPARGAHAALVAVVRVPGDGVARGQLYRIPELSDLQDYHVDEQVESHYEKMIEFFGTMFGWYKL